MSTSICRMVIGLLRGIGGKAVEIKAVLRLGTATEAGLKVLQSPDGGECTVIRFSADNKLTIDTSHSSLLKNLRPRSPETGPLVLEKGEPLELRLFIDRSIVEVFANQRSFLGVRVYPTKEDASGVSLFSTGGDAELVASRHGKCVRFGPNSRGRKASDRDIWSERQRIRRGSRAGQPASRLQEQKH